MEITLTFDIIIFNKLVVIIACPTSKTKHWKLFFNLKNDKCNLKSTIQYIKISWSISQLCLTCTNLQYWVPKVTGFWQASSSPRHGQQVHAAGTLLNQPSSLQKRKRKLVCLKGVLENQAKMHVKFLGRRKIDGWVWAVAWNRAGQGSLGKQGESHSEFQRGFSISSGLL